MFQHPLRTRAQRVAAQPHEPAEEGGGIDLAEDLADLMGTRGPESRLDWICTHDTSSQ
jgi:hypothetical protein